MESGLGNIEFVHFNEPEKIDEFIDFIKDKNITISHRCCSGNGLGIFLNENMDLKKIIKDFTNPPAKKIELIETVPANCCVCREKTTSALNCIVPHHICFECIQHIKNECPYCRRKINK